MDVGKLALLFTVVLMAAGATGCLETVGDETKGALGADEDPTRDQTDQDTKTDELEEGHAHSNYRAALASVNEGGEHVPDRFAIEMEADALETGETGYAKSLVDAEKQLRIDHYQGATLVSQSSSVGPDEAETLLVGAVNTTVILGFPGALVAGHNDTAEPMVPEPRIGGLETAKEQATSADTIGPAAIVERMATLPSDAELTQEVIQWNGEDAVEIKGSHENETVTLDLRMVYLQEDNLPVRIEIEQQLADPLDALERHGQFTMTFAYGENATSPYEEMAIRAEAMALFDVEDIGNPILKDEPKGEWTIQPSARPGLVPLDEAEVFVYKSSASGESTTGTILPEEAQVLRLPAEEGIVENDKVRIEYEDRDGDGAVSPGDKINLTSKDGNEYLMALHDEKTGAKLVPGPGLLAAVAAAAAAAGFRGRRWSR